jgi:hypothetical protein
VEAEQAYAIDAGPAARMDFSGGALKILVHHPVTNTPFPINLNIEIEQTGTSIRAKIHSKQLRNRGSSVGGYFGTVYVRRPKLMFHSTSGGKDYELLISNHNLGTFATPWTSAPINLSDRTYTLVFETDGISLFLDQGQPVKIKVTGNTTFSKSSGFMKGSSPLNY